MSQFMVIAVMKIKVEIPSELEWRVADAVVKDVRLIMIRSKQLHRRIKQIGVQPQHVVNLAGSTYQGLSV